MFHRRWTLVEIFAEESNAGSDAVDDAVNPKNNALTLGNG